MPVPLPARAALLLVFDHQDGGVAADLLDGALDRGLGDIGRADSGVFTVIDEQDLVEDDLVSLLVFLALGGRKLLDRDRVPFRDRVLLAAGLDDCEFHSRNTIQESPRKGNLAFILRLLFRFRPLYGRNLDARRLVGYAQYVLVYLQEFFAGIIVMIDHSAER